MSSDNNDRPAPPSAPEIQSATSPRDGCDASAAPAPEKTPAPLPSHSLFRSDREEEDCLPPAARYSSEAEPHHHDGEDDHSMTDFDLHAEITTRLDKNPAPVSAPMPSPAPDRKPEAPAGGDDDYFPEDERSSMDWETDSSMTDFDLNAELEARLGKAPPLPPADERPAPDPGPCLTPAGADLSAPHEQYFPEDERSSPDWEDDHSMTSFDPDDEVADRLGRAKPSPAAPAGVQPSDAPSPAAGTAHDKAYYPDDERSSMDWEDDHSTADFDLNAEIDSRLGKAAGEKPDAATTGDDGYYVHPGLAASLSASLAYAQNGLRPDDDERPDKAAESGDKPHGDEAIRKAAADAVSEVTAGDTPDDQPEQEKKRPFDDAGPGPASDSSAPEQTDSAGNVPAASESAAPAPASGGAGGGDDDDDDEAEEEEDDEDGEEEEEDSGLGRPMTLRDHLNELRKRITWAFLWAIVGFIACYPFAQELFNLLLAPLTKVLPSAGHLIYTSPPEAFFIYMKVAFVAGLFVTSPLVFYQIWAFVAPGLYKEEKVYIIPIAFFSALFFICGGAFCYFITFPFAFEFFMSYSTDVIVAMPALDETLSFVLQLLLAFGLIFELPLFVFFLARLGIVTAAMMRKFRRYSILANVIIAAILTPPDVMSQMLMAGPLVLLYELSILIAAFFGKKTEEPAKDEEEEDGDEEDEEEDGDTPRPATQG